VGFGLAETMGMAGADIVYYETASQRLIDSFAMKNGKPTTDKCQDWQLVSAEQSRDNLAVEMRRALVSSDTQDRNITNDSAVPLLPNAVIAAWGEGAIQHHCGTCRVGAAVRFFGAGDDSNVLNSPMHGVRGDTSLETHDITVTNHAIKEQKTEYAEFCFDLQTRLGRANTTTVRLLWYVTLSYMHVSGNRGTCHVRKYVVVCAPASASHVCMIYM